MVHAVSLSVVLFITWLLLSGHYGALLLSLGVASCAFVVWLAHRMDVADREGHPIHLTWRSLVYWPWLAWEIVRSNIAVTRLILSPAMPVSPRVFTVQASQGDDLGWVIYANSITLTPGTVTLYVRGPALEIHAITEDMAEDLESGEMDRRVTAMAGSP